MPRAQRFPALLFVVVGCAILNAPAYADQNDPHGLLFQVPLPGGVRAALDAMGDHGVADRSRFLLNVIRRHHHTAARGTDARRDPALAALVAHLDRAAGEHRRHARPVETVPLPLSPEIWLDVVFAARATRATEDTLVSAILQSRGAALLYHGLLSLDGETRAWLAARPDLITGIVSGGAAAFATAAPGLRASGGAVRLPGGAAAAPAWEALVGRPADEPAAFIQALLAPGRGRLAYFVGSMAQLTPPQIALAMNLASADPADRIGATQRLLGVFEGLGWDWNVEERAFWRPALDPALLLAELATSEDGRPMLPGTPAFWRLAFADMRRGLSRATSEVDARAAAAGEPVDFVWLAEQVFNGARTGQDTRYQLVLFASRIVRHVTPGTARDAIDAVRAAGAYPALAAALERAGVIDQAVFASAGRRAARLSAIRQRARARRALAQFQGTLAVLTRAAARDTLARDSLGPAVASLAALETSARGDYEGRLVRWLHTHLREAAASAGARDGIPARTDGGRFGTDASMDSMLVRALTGPAPVPPRVIDWEGTRYRLDLAHAEAVLLAGLLGREARPYASSALALVTVADALAAGPSVDELRGRAADLDQIAHAAGWGHRRPTAVDAVQRRARVGDVGGAARLVPELRILADDLLGRGLVELAYAAALGQPERSQITAGEAAGRHDFGLGGGNWRHNAAWQAPVERMHAAHGWQVTGSLLDLDVRLAPFALVQLSSKPPARRPTLNDQDRRVLIETVALVEPASLTDADRDTIVAAIRRGRARVAALGTRPEALALADEIRVSPAKRSLLPWVVAHDPDAVSRFLSPGELLWLGLDRRPVRPELHAWGAPGRPRLGCHCLRLVDPRPWEMFAGRWHSGILVSAFPDLTLRLAELLAELEMPAPLLGGVLAPAMLDFVNLVVSRHPDDRRGLVDFVQALRVDQVEQYLAALTTGGPLVPIGEAPQPTAASGASELEVPR